MNESRRSAGWWVALGAVALAAALALPTASIAAPPVKTTPAGKEPPSHHGQAGSARGIVQSVAARVVVVKELDGTTVLIPVGTSTHVFFDGRRATLAYVRPGLVAIASWKANKAAAKLQIFDASATIAVVHSVAARSVVVTMPAGANVTIRATPKTRVLVDGKPSQLHAVKPGFLLVIKGAVPTSRPATELRFLRPS
jgi:hypothetical protein